MRSVQKKIGIVLVTLLGLGLSACAPQSEEVFDATSIACEDVSAEVSAATEALESSEASLEDASGTPAEVSVKADIAAAQARLSGLEERSSECSEEPAVETVVEDEKCADTWAMASSDYENNRWFGDGIAAIKSAKTDEDAADAASTWLEGVRKDPALLSGASVYFLDQKVDKTTLIDGNDCATEEAAELAIQLELTIVDAQSIVPDAAPANGYNSGVNNGTVVGDTTPGIGGDRTAIKIVTKDGKTIWIMARCGNIVTEGKPPVPPGTTDNPPCPPGQVKNENGVCVVPKSSNPDDYRQPGDGGKGQDVGTGTKPPAPAPTTPPESTPPPVNTSQPGGGGVVDSPTNPPGSETGVTAPGATPPPTTAPAPPPPNEGGDNGEGEVVPEPNW